jgi:hypothetical protein
MGMPDAGNGRIITAWKVDLRRKIKMNIKPILCELGPNGKCPEGCYTNDGPLCDFDKCPYENEADKKNGIKAATKEETAKRGV